MGEYERDDDEQGSQATLVDDTPAATVAEMLLNRCNALLDELEQFGKLLEEKQLAPILGHRAFIQDTNAEKRFIERLLQKARDAATEDASAAEAFEADRRFKHQLSSTNITSYEAQWAAVKRCRGLVSLRQNFSRNPSQQRRGPYKTKKQSRNASPGTRIKAHVKKTQDAVLVDAVVDNGAEWLKVSAVSERQLLFQMARQGWRNDSDSDSDFDDDVTLGSRQRGAGYDSDDDDEDEIVIVRLAKHLVAAARANRHAYRHPRIRLVLPKITEGSVKEIDALLSKIRGMSTPSVPITLEAAASAFNTSPLPPLPTTLSNLLVDEFAGLTDVLNIDCTLLVAFASDISHARVAVQPWYPTAVQAQIRDERRQSLLPHALYPALGARELVCTREAAQRMREIVATIGTESEVARAALLLAPEDGGKGEQTREELLDAFQKWSIYPVPRDLRLPIRVVESDVDELLLTATSGDNDDTSSSSSANKKEGSAPPKLPRVAAAVAPHLTDINRSIFLHGWAHGRTTLSSNGTVAKQIETLVEQNRTADDEVGPHVWLCPVARSLVAKKGRQQ